MLRTQKYVYRKRSIIIVTQIKTVALWWNPAWPKRYWFGIEHYQCDTVYKCMKLSETSACCTEPLAVVCFNGSLSDSVVEDVWDIFKIDGPVLGTLGCWVGTRPISVERYLRNSRLTDGMSTPWCWVEGIWDFQDWWLDLVDLVRWVLIRLKC